jgi:REP element-mobilizing transposase RayT
MRERLHGYLAEVVAGTGSHAVAINSVEDHMHVLCDLHRTVAVSTVVERMKSASSKWMQEQGQAAFAWQGGYGAFAVSMGAVAEVVAYIAEQREHHRGRSFQEEMRELLRRNQVEWDERYVWE